MVDVPLGQKEIFKVGLVESPHEDVSKALLSGDRPNSKKSIGLMAKFPGFEKGALSGQYVLLSDRFDERCTSVKGL
ncbi:hypothetical protein Ddye_018792 [Dipteronia dyeriana]|uniref:Uncharacterized protein n=1 Tax=Dipteronia dyeriana TaxID=168575 RepID=A0AAD9X1Z9_9ROSI|nr:hypothetical protein Ddye_018792 [Dipteronia dyeriana]